MVGASIESHEREDGCSEEMAVRQHGPPKNGER